MLSTGIEPPRRNMQILLADDSAQSRGRVRSLLQERGYRAVEAVDGLQALRLCHSERPDCVITDFAMPTLGGLQLIRAFRQSKDGVPVIVVTTDQTESMRRQCLEAGATAVLYKPLELESLRHLLDNGQPLSVTGADAGECERV